MVKKIILFIVLVIIVIVAWYFIYKKPAIAPAPEVSAEEQACIDSGGIVTTANCCKSSSDFPNSCLIGACGCSLENSKEVKICDCGDGCWDGTKCVARENEVDTADWEIYTNSKYSYTMKHPADWEVKHEFGPNQILNGLYESNEFKASNGYALLFAVVPKDGNVMAIPRTGVGAGDFVDSDETINIGGTEAGIKYLVFQGKVKEIFINEFEVNGYKGKAYISYFGSEKYEDFDMTGAEEVEIAKAILESFELPQ